MTELPPSKNTLATAGGTCTWVPGYSADEMRAYDQAAVLAEREAAKKIAEDHAANKSPPYKSHEDTYLNGWLDASNEIGWAIRARGV